MTSLHFLNAFTEDDDVPTLHLAPGGGLRWPGNDATMTATWTAGLAAVASGFMQHQEWQVSRAERASRAAESTLRQTRELLATVREDRDWGLP